MERLKVSDLPLVFRGKEILKSVRVGKQICRDLPSIQIPVRIVNLVGDQTAESTANGRGRITVTPIHTFTIYLFSSFSVRVLHIAHDSVRLGEMLDHLLADFSNGHFVPFL